MINDKKVPAIPAVRVEDPAAQRVLEAMKALLESREGVHDPLDKTITLRDLVSLGIVEVDVQRLGKYVTAAVLPTVTGEEDSAWASIPPPEVVNFSAVGAFASIVLDWESPIYSNHAYVEVWRASVLEGEDPPSIGDAVMVAQVTNGPYSDSPPASNDDRRFYYWVRNISTSGLKSGFAGPEYAKLAVDPGYVLSVLLGTAGSEYANTPLLVEVPYATTLNGVYVPAGVYIRDLYVQNGTITNAKIANLAVDDAKISNVTASKIKTGTLDVGQTITVDGVIQGGKNAYGSTQAGFWIGNDGGTYRFSIGDANTYMTWNGVELEIKGVFTAPTINSATITATEIIGGEVRYGKGSFADTTQGYWLGMDAGLGKLNIGDATQYVQWDGSTLAVSGLIYTSALIASEITQSVMDNSNTLIAPNFILDPAYIPGLGGGMRVAADGQPLDDVTNPPTRLCYPAYLRDASCPVIASSGSEVRAHLNPLPSKTSTGRVYTYGLDTVSANNVFQAASTTSKKLRCAVVRRRYDSPNFITGIPDKLAEMVGLCAPLWVSDGVVTVRSFVNDKLRTYDFDEPGYYGRASQSTAILRVRLTDKALFNPADPTIAGTSLPPHWMAGYAGNLFTSGYKPAGWPGASGDYGVAGRLFQIYIYPPYTSAPADVPDAVAQNAVADALYCKRTVTAGVAQPPPTPGYVLDLSSGVFAPTIGATDVFSVRSMGLTGSAVTEIQNPFVNSRFISTAMTPGVVSQFTENGWDITASFSTSGGDVSLVAERVIPYSGVPVGLGYTVTAKIGTGMTGPYNHLAAPAAVGDPWVTYYFDYQWNHLDIQVEIDADNRPFSQDILTL